MTSIDIKLKEALICVCWKHGNFSSILPPQGLRIVRTRHKSDHRATDKMVTTLKKPGRQKPEYNRNQSESTLSTVCVTKDDIVTSLAGTFQNTVALYNVDTNLVLYLLLAIKC